MIDTHAHLFLSKQSEGEFLEKSLARGVRHIINVATNIQNSRLAAQTANRVSAVSSTVGIHPCEADRLPESELENVETLARSFQAVAIGEIGLDGYRSPVTDRQIHWLHYQLDVAARLELPAIIHCRNAANELGSVLNQYPSVKKVIHCFSEDDRFIDQVDGPNTFYSFTGLLTYPAAENSIRAAKWLPIEKIMVETDSPYLTPSRYKGQANYSGLLDAIVDELALIRGVSVDYVIETTSQNAQAFFNLTDAAVSG